MSAIAKAEHVHPHLLRVRHEDSPIDREGNVTHLAENARLFAMQSSNDCDLSAIRCVNEHSAAAFVAQQDIASPIEIDSVRTCATRKEAAHMLSAILKHLP